MSRSNAEIKDVEYTLYSVLLRDKKSKYFVIQSITWSDDVVTNNALASSYNRANAEKIQAIMQSDFDDFYKK